MQSKASARFSTKCLFLPRNNQWLRRTIVVLAFILFDYLSTLIFIRSPHEEANVYARILMTELGMPLGLTLFVLLANLPIYITLNLDSHLIKLPRRISILSETAVDLIFAWFIAGLHFSGGTSWFWPAPDPARQILGASIYLIAAFALVKPYKTRYDVQ